MIVCLCRGVSDRAVREAVRSGASGAEEVGRLTGAGTDCGCCRGTIAGIVAREVPAPSACAGACADCPDRPRGVEAPPPRVAAARQA